MPGLADRRRGDVRLGGLPRGAGRCRGNGVGGERIGGGTSICSFAWTNSNDGAAVADEVVLGRVRAELADFRPARFFN